ncbi:transcriptional regulator, AraC family [Gloeocapsa sp. PCC 7428]|uniref:helix-turn-helix transcriptional regulator n=1 Tax=Gloeocapsa sp. PCC 7428 TaxID=1173026 RepID=UPI0002A5CD73|nr:AraC family transcriptional regulator [Gloeocapsa sp. PCC 7428]AFZ28689.1 transcriptional regulator, AraC family [Gloeocapsa sp. PCC 7428]
MTITLLHREYDELWQHSHVIKLEPFETVEECPQQLGNGYQRWILLNGIDLLIHDYEFCDDVVIKLEETSGCIEFGFQVLGHHQYPNRTRSGGQNFVEWGAAKNAIAQKSAGRILQVDIHLDSPELLHYFCTSNSSLPLAIQQLIAGNEQPYDHIGSITPTMKLVLEQILNCPYQGATKQMYLGAKCLELIAMKIAQLSEVNHKTYPRLSRSEIDQIHQAKDIITQNLCDPPSLLSLARQVGLNDCTLKRGFRQVFGTSVFGYLHDRRMEYARKLLEEQAMTITGVAAMVGYANRGHFAAAFRKKFGVSPSHYLSHYRVS